MENNNTTIPSNPFFTRGCTHAMKSHKPEQAFSHGICKLDVFDWLKDIKPPYGIKPFNFIEVRFKNSRKDFYQLNGETDIHTGDIIAVEALPGHDIGIVTLTGDLVRLQMKKKKIDIKNTEIKKVYRKARSSDVEKWIVSIEREELALFKTRELASRFNLKMKVNDVEFQGDGTKAIFYYTADDRVDFRELIKALAETFRIRVEMKQIGVRQEASRLGGIGSCGRELCCCTWLGSYSSVTTQAARIQQLSLNPQKLAGQCGKLKCCLNYEYETYTDALKGFPSPEVTLKTQKGDAIHQKTDIFRKLMWYSYVSDQANLLAIPIDKVREIIQNNKNGIFPEKLEDFAQTKEHKAEFDQVLTQEDINRFDKDE
ncbi:MAG: hypothetical protein M0R21_06000 [Lentimicrobiaceae bacterium]|nr:hypothetical protein [Lentimicrobiaceae bacterium]